MSDIAIKVANLSKQYRLGEHQQGYYKTLRESVMNSLKAPFRRRPSAVSGHSPDTIWALKDVSFEIRQGEVVGIIGRNGAGKTTLLKILSRITEPTEGRAEIHGRVGSLLEVGTGFHPELTGRENIYLNGAILGMRKGEIERRFDEIVDFAEIAKFIDTPVKRYSSGMYVRLAFAVAAHLEPDILLVDEVLAVGDVAFQKKCLGKMGQVAEGGRTVLFVSHNMAAIKGLCSRSLCLGEGRMLVDGHTDAVITHYLMMGRPLKDQSLAEREDRRGSGLVRITGIRFIDPKSGEPLEFALTGQGLSIEVSYKVHNSSLERISRFNIGLSLSSYFGQRVTILNSNQASKAFENLPPSGCVYCYIPKLSLMGGTYLVSCTLQINGHLADQVADATVLHIEAGDFYGTGISAPHHRHGVYLEHDWYVATPTS